MNGESHLDLRIPQQERAFIQALPPQPTGNFVIALAGIARTACRHDVFKSVASAA